ncbi:hypothetical protein CC78DRAFT_573417 [Lojkania enalia]|uniref:Uncharacterized protein n=1 Tax=Lojkania enalia TaxID=147567 RepID=A0A9P4TR12_9PLEO|nr:hypothetical protein CC78DRAFT_573417 [Didymosphaeria enalia]
MAQNERSPAGRHGVQENRAIQNMPTNMAPTMSAEDEVIADADEPPDLRRTPRPSVLKLHESFKASFSKLLPSRCERKQSLLTTALHSNDSSPTEERPGNPTLGRGMSCVSTCSNNSASTAELTSDGGFTSPGTRAETPSPPLPPTTFHNIMLPFNKKPFEQPISVIRHDDEHISPLEKKFPTTSGEDNVEATLGRKRCITFACRGKDERKPHSEEIKPKASSQQTTEPPKRVSTIKFACPTKVSTDAPSKTNKPRMPRAASPAPPPQKIRGSPKAPPKSHRGSDSTVRNPSPVAMRKATAVDRSRRLSANSDLARCSAFRFHEFASSEDEEEEWVQESTCHRNRLTVNDTLRVENSLRQLGEEAEEEALDDEMEEDAEEDVDRDIEDDDILDEDDVDDDVSDEGFQTDDEDGFAGSDDESNAGSDYNWWAPGYSTAATSIEHLEHVQHIRPVSRRSFSESSVGSAPSETGFLNRSEKLSKRRKSRPVNIRVPSPELPDSTDFVCGTLDEDRPLEAAYLSCLEQRRAAKHKVTPQDIDPTFPTSDPEMDEEDEDDEVDDVASESDQYVMMHGQMDPLDIEFRGRSKHASTKRSPATSPKRLRSPPPNKRSVHRSPRPRKLFGNSPRRLRSPAPVRLRSPPPTRRGSTVMSPKRPEMHISFVGLAERPALTMSSSLPRTPVTTVPPEDLEDEDTCRETPIRRAIDIKIGLENKRQRRKEQLYKKMHRKGAKEKRCPPGKGLERMREMGLGLAAHKGKTTGLTFGMDSPPTPDQNDMHVLAANGELAPHKTFFLRHTGDLLVADLMLAGWTWRLLNAKEFPQQYSCQTCDISLPSGSGCVCADSAGRSSLGEEHQLGAAGGVNGGLQGAYPFRLGAGGCSIRRELMSGPDIHGVSEAQAARHNVPIGGIGTAAPEMCCSVARRRPPAALKFLSFFPRLVWTAVVNHGQLRLTRGGCAQCSSKIHGEPHASRAAAGFTSAI